MYPRGRRGGFAKALGGATRARVRLPPSPPIFINGVVEPNKIRGLRVEERQKTGAYHKLTTNCDRIEKETPKRKRPSPVVFVLLSYLKWMFFSERLIQYIYY